MCSEMCIRDSDNTGKDQSLDAIVQAFRSGRVNESDMDNLAASATRFVGKNPQADQLFRDIITNDQYNLEINDANRCRFLFHS